MLLIFVEHYLKEDGKSYFPGWINDIKKVLQNHEGFIDIKHIEDVEDSNRSLLFLYFQNLELLRKWAKSDDHEQALLKLQPYMLKKQKSQILRIDLL